MVTEEMGSYDIEWVGCVQPCGLLDEKAVLHLYDSNNRYKAVLEDIDGDWLINVYECENLQCLMSSVLHICTLHNIRFFTMVYIKEK